MTNIEKFKLKIKTKDQWSTEEILDLLDNSTETVYKFCYVCNQGGTEITEATTLEEVREILDFWQIEFDESISDVDKEKYAVSLQPEVKILGEWTKGEKKEETSQ